MDFTTFRNTIAGHPRASDSWYAAASPTTRACLWRAPVATAADVDAAVEAARTAFPSWAATPYSERTRLLEHFADRYLAQVAGFTQVLQAETGRSPRAAAIEAHWAANWLRYPARYQLPETRLEDDEKVVATTYEPLGIVAAICPWNFPLMLAMGKIAQAVATGNCVVVKPSPAAPYSALKLVELAQEVFPPSVVQALGGDEQLGPLLVAHAGINKISFTGSTTTGKKVMRACADTTKRVTLEMAGNNAAIILPDVDIQKTALHTAHALWFNAGQVCLAARRLLIHESIYEAFVAALAAATDALAADLAANVGPIQNEAQFQRICESVQQCRDQGLRFATGEDQSATPAGLFVHPVIVDNAPEEAAVVQEEQFGPIIPCKPFSSLDDAVNAANRTDSGLAAIVWTTNEQLGAQLAARLQVGSVFINGPPKPDPFVAFGGHKQSGLGVEYGLEGLLGCCQLKAVHRYKQ